MSASCESLVVEMRMQMSSLCLRLLLAPTLSLVSPPRREGDHCPVQRWLADAVLPGVYQRAWGARARGEGAADVAVLSTLSAMGPCAGRKAQGTWRRGGQTGRQAGKGGREGGREGEGGRAYWPSTGRCMQTRIDSMRHACSLETHVQMRHRTQGTSPGVS